MRTFADSCSLVRRRRCGVNWWFKCMVITSGGLHVVGVETRGAMAARGCWMVWVLAENLPANAETRTTCSSSNSGINGQPKHRNGGVERWTSKVSFHAIPPITQTAKHAPNRRTRFDYVDPFSKSLPESLVSPG